MPRKQPAIDALAQARDQDGWVWTDSIEPWLPPELVAQRRWAWADRDTWVCPRHHEAVLRHERLSQFSGRSYRVCPRCDRVVDWVRLGISPSEERRREAQETERPEEMA